MGKFLLGVLTGIAAVVTTALVSDKVDTYLYCKANPLHENENPVSEETGETEDE
mgnify:FL=1